jgi:hypothetical protein
VFIRDILRPPLDDRKKTFLTHAAFMSLEEFVWGIFVLAEVVLRRELQASALTITLFTILNPASSLFSVYFSQVLSARPDHIYRHIRLVAVLTRLPLVLFFVWHDSVSLLLLFGLFNIGVAMLKPVQSIYMQENFREGEIGKLYGIAVSIAKVFFIAASYGFGLWMDVNHSSYITAFGGSGIVAFISVMLLIFIPFRGWRTVEAATAPKDVLGFATTRETLRNNAPFRRYEAAFFTYGAGFMVVLPAMPILLVDHLDLSYSVVSFGRGVMTALLIILLTPLLGKVLDRTNPIYLSMVSFFVLIAYPSLLIAAWFLRGAVEPLFYLSFVAFGIAMAGVTLTWNVGPMYFAATPQEIPRLMSVHVTLTGVRGLLVPILGYFLLKIGVLVPFMASICFFFTAALMMRRDAKNLLTAEKKSV